MPENVDNAYTNAKPAQKESTPARSKQLVLNDLSGWACVELNHGPHAYQANS